MRNFPFRPVGILLLLFCFQVSQAQYVFQEPVPEAISLHPYTTIADVGAQEFNVHFVAQQYAKLNFKKLKTENDDLGFTDHHF